MILVLTGSHYIPFDRLLSHLEYFHQKRPNEKIVIQSGNSKIFVPQAKILPFIPHPELVKYIKSARVVVAHAGPATILEILKYSSYRPIVVPRRKKFAEHVSDHQWYFASYLKDKNIITVVETKEKLFYALTHPRAVVLRNFGEDNKNECIKKLRSYISSLP